MAQQRNITTTATPSRAYGAIYWATPAATANETNTPIKCAGTTAAQSTANKITQATTNRLTFTGSDTRAFGVVFTGIMTASAATNATVYIYANGAVVTGVGNTRAMPITDKGNAVLNCFVDLAPGGYIELWCETDDGDNITIESGVLAIRSID